jgi:hypothetical protein
MCWTTTTTTTTTHNSNNNNNTHTVPCEKAVSTQRVVTTRSKEERDWMNTQKNLVEKAVLQCVLIVDEACTERERERKRE